LHTRVDAFESNSPPFSNVGKDSPRRGSTGMERSGFLAEQLEIAFDFFSE